MIHIVTNNNTTNEAEADHCLSPTFSPRLANKMTKCSKNHSELKVTTKIPTSTPARLPLNFSSLGLYGRSDEIAILLQSFQSIQLPDARSRMVLVQGASGTGKSALVQHLQSTIERDSDALLFVAGKYDQYPDTARPYSAIVDAMTELCHLLHSSAEFHEIQAKVQDAIADQCHVLTNLIPAIELLLSEKLRIIDSDMALSIHKTTTEFAMKRFTDLFRSFLRAVCSSQNPIVFFLDDLQWTDDASRRLLSALVRDTKSTNLLFIGATRDTSCDAQNALFGRDLSKEMFFTTKIFIGPLSLDDLNCLIASLVELQPQRTRDLAGIVYRKTNGNAFFVIQYMEMLHREGLLDFNFGSSHWEWDVQAIATSTNVSENVVQLLTQKMESLPIQVQRILMVAACLGFVFDATVLGELLSLPQLWSNSGRTLKDIDDSEMSLQQALETAIQVGLVESTSSPDKYKFSHDRVQQSAMAMLPEGSEGRRVQVQFGETILNMSRSDNAADWMLFTAVDLLTRNSEHIVDKNPAHAREIAHASLEAARKASEKSAFLSAARFADSGFRLLSEEHRWEDDYQLCLELRTLSSSMHYSYGDFDSSNDSIKDVLTNAKSLQDKFAVYKVHLALFGSRGDLNGGIAEGLMILKQIGVNLPARPNILQVLSTFKKTKRLLGGRKAKDLTNLPPIADTTVVEALRVLNTITIYSWHAGELNMCIQQCLVMMQLTLKHGISQFSPYAIAAYGGTITNFGSLEEAFEFGSLALELLQRPGMREEAPATVKIVHLFIYHLRKPVYDSLDPLIHAYRISLETGDMQIAARILTLHAILSAVAGMPIESLAKQIEGYCEFFREYSQKDCLMDILPWLQFTRSLMGNSNPLELEAGSFKEEEELTRLKEEHSLAGNLTVLLYEASANALLLYVFGEYELAYNECVKLNKLEDIGFSYFMKPFCQFFSGLTSLALARKNKRVKRIMYRRQGRSCMNILRKFAGGGSVNCVPKLKLLEAEDSALMREKQAVTVSKYDTAISVAARCGFRLIKAIACERAGSYLLDCGQASEANDYLVRAWVEFADYGAKAKLQHMEQKYDKVDFSKSSSMRSLSKSSSVRLLPNLTTEWKSKSKSDLFS